MALIRNAQAATMARDAIVLDLGELSRQGDRILGQAKFQAQKILEKTQAECARLITDAEKIGLAQGEKRGYEAGFRKGQEIGTSQAREQVAQDLQRLAVAWADALEGFETVRVALLREAKLDVLRVALGVAERVTKRAVEMDEASAGAQLEAALGMITRASRLRIACSPDDAELLRQMTPALARKFSTMAHAEIVEDPKLSRGSVIVRTDKGEVDASIETQIARICEALMPDRDATALPREEPGDGAAQ